MYGQTNNTQQAMTENLAAHRLAGNEAIHLYVFTCGVFMSWCWAELLHDAKPLHFEETTFGSRNLISGILRKPCFCSSDGKARHYQRQGQSSFPKALVKPLCTVSVGINTSVKNVNVKRSLTAITAA